MYFQDCRYPQPPLTRWFGDDLRGLGILSSFILPWPVAGEKGKVGSGQKEELKQESICLSPLGKKIRWQKGHQPRKIIFCISLLLCKTLRRYSPLNLEGENTCHVFVCLPQHYFHGNVGAGDVFLLPQVDTFQKSTVCGVWGSAMCEGPPCCHSKGRQRLDLVSGCKWTGAEFSAELDFAHHSCCDGIRGVWKPRKAFAKTERAWALRWYVCMLKHPGRPG